MQRKETLGNSTAFSPICHPSLISFTPPFTLIVVHFVELIAESWSRGAESRSKTAEAAKEIITSLCGGGSNL